MWGSVAEAGAKRDGHNSHLASVQGAVDKDIVFCGSCAGFFNHEFQEGYFYGILV